MNGRKISTGRRRRPWLPLLAASSLVLAGQGCDPADRGSVDDSTPSSGPWRSADASPIVGGQTNVILLIIDTLRADRLSAYGFQEPTTPEIDRLAEEGVRFAKAVAQCSWTRPSIGSMVTGIHPRTLGLYEEKRERLGQEFVTLAELFKNHGYTTVGVTANPNINSVFGFGQGFDAYVDSDRVWGWMKDDPEAHDAAGKPVVKTGSLLSAEDAFDRTFELIEAHPEGPYYAQIDIMEMHAYGAPIRAAFWGYFSGTLDTDYVNKLRQVSHDVGAFIERWLATVGLEDTLVVITSDHGEGLGDHPGIRDGDVHGFTLYETQLLVPLILYHSKGGLGSGVVVDQPVRVIDLYPTLAELLRFEPVDSVDGRSLVPVIEQPGRRLDLPELFVSETYFMGTDKRSVYSPQWNYYRNLDRWSGTDPRELQQPGGPEDGSRTNRRDEDPAALQALDAYLGEWEANHPKAAPILSDEPTEEVMEQLRSLGYVD